MEGGDDMSTINQNMFQALSRDEVSLVEGGNTILHDVIEFVLQVSVALPSKLPFF